jgi:hypothetical protein
MVLRITDTQQYNSKGGIKIVYITRGDQFNVRQLITSGNTDDVF